MRLQHLGAAAIACLLLSGGAASAQTAPATDATTTPAATAPATTDVPVTAPADTRDHDGFPWGLLGLAGLAGLLGMRRRDDRPVVDTTVNRTTRP
ncbi:MAG: WGxxGxxG-CTERM domain-containing protein [Caulobacteraceae bacterium]|nr:WGxxGxxG-CTERM domain-containing protein [Caulobacteraceae bacterium]